MRNLISLIAMIFGWALCASAEVHTVIVKDHEYVPRDISITEGDTVRWYWQDDFHDVIAGTYVEPSAAFASEILNATNLFEVVVTREMLRDFPLQNGKYDYFCSPHATMNMAGTIAVTRPDKSFRAVTHEWEVQPRTRSTASATCELTLTGDETHLSFTCTSDLSSLSGIELRRGAPGINGALICQSSAATGSCDLPQEVADGLFGGELYVALLTPGFPGGELRGQIVLADRVYSVTGRITTQDGTPVADALVTDGTRQVTTDAAGNFTLPDVPNGVYQLRAFFSGMTIRPDPGTSPMFMNRAHVVQRNFTAFPNQRNVAFDFDGDGISDTGGVITKDLASESESIEITLSSSGSLQSIPLPGSSADQLVYGYYSSDNMCDVATVTNADPSLLWNVRQSEDGMPSSFNFGEHGDTAIQDCDFDGDRISDPATVNSKGVTYRASLDNAVHTITLPSRREKTKPICADVDNDGRDEIIAIKTLPLRPGQTKKQHLLQALSSLGRRIIRRNIPLHSPTAPIAADIDGDGTENLGYLTKPRAGKGLAYFYLKSAKKPSKYSFPRAQSVSVGTFLGVDGSPHDGLLITLPDGTQQRHIFE